MKHTTATIALALCAALLAGQPLLVQGEQSDAASVVAEPARQGYVFPKFSVEKNPIVITKPDGERFTFLRTGRTTCGKYVMALVDVPAGGGRLHTSIIRATSGSTSQKGR